MLKWVEGTSSTIYRDFLTIVGYFTALHVLKKLHLCFVCYTQVFFFTNQVLVLCFRTILFTLVHVILFLKRITVLYKAVAYIVILSINQLVYAVQIYHNRVLNM
jgi:hypothetical protein